MFNSSSQYLSKIRYVGYKNKIAGFYESKSAKHTPFKMLEYEQLPYEKVRTVPASCSFLLEW